VGRTPVKRLSGGQQQRLSLALALVARPELVFLDEPTAGMDPQARRVTWDLIRTLCADGVSVVLTTHFLDEAEQLADTVVVIDSGRVVAAGTPAELTRAGAEGQIRFRAQAQLHMSSLLSALPDGCTAIEVQPGEYLVTGDVTPQLLATLTAWCAGQDVLAENLAVERRTLEDVFLDLTGRELRT
jgi:ABC-2 type transport system ATP-binding protein